MARAVAGVAVMLCGALLAPLLRAGTSPPAVRVPLVVDESYDASVLTYVAGGLALRALVAVPRTPPPPGGFPVIVANHGFHPEPARYGYTADGRNLRPGDYYRAVPRWYTAAGLLVVMPDYRGHNDSEGSSQRDSPDAAREYGADVAALLEVLPQLAEANPGRVLLWGHSLGAAVTLQALAHATRGGHHERVRVLGASLWSGSGAASALGDLEVPILIQHARADAVAPAADSEQLGRVLALRGRLEALHLLPGADHFFAGAQAAAAVERDVRFFRRLIAEAESK